MDHDSHAKFTYEILTTLETSHNVGMPLLQSLLAIMFLQIVHKIEFARTTFQHTLYGNSTDVLSAVVFYALFFHYSLSFLQPTVQIIICLSYDDQVSSI